MIKKYIKGIITKEEGSIIYLAAFAIVAFLSICALSMDLGRVYLNRASMQSAIDSAALAAAYQLPDTTAAEEKANEYMEKNGYTAEDIDVLFEYNNTVVRINGRKQIQTSFAKLLSIDYVNVGVTACAKKDNKPLDKALEYLIFTKSDSYKLYLGGTFYIYGSVHSNGSLSMSPSYGYIQGSAESCNSFYANPSTTTIGSKVLNAPYINMPDFSEKMQGVMPVYYETVLNASDVNKISTKQYFTGNTKIIGNCVIPNQAVITGNLYVEGNLTINGGAPACVLDGNIYATGSISFSNTFSGKGCVLAKGSVSFQGGGAEFDSGSPICIYSETGNISLSTASSEIHGMVIAPNGTISIQGGTTTFYGSIMANQVSGVPAVLKMYLLDMDMPFETTETVTRLVE